MLIDHIKKIIHACRSHKRSKSSRNSGNRIFVFLTILALTLFMSIVILEPALAISFTPEVPVPGQGETVQLQNNTSPIGNYIKTVYRYAIGGVGILAAVVMMFGGVIWITAGGNASRVGEAKAWIGAALSGLVLALLSYMVLNAINPALINFRISTIEPIESDGLTETAPGAEGWIFDSGIGRQMSDASPELAEMLNCLRANLPEGVGRISSISDSYGLNQCRLHYDPRSCAHMENSCHYGGGTGNRSYAVDLGDEENISAITEAASQCSQYVGFILDEGNHIHISSVACPRN
ncbi:hypothetical protein A2303_02390 [Candidatus Falkowbacteria bacterium RIFOXYB2_FULL_47_14]|nr:MAG: hypothetical protein A2303_02390 [Candidatus Falkowbacteria bacterium RIFOXYB2_FULL_47_14]